MKRIVLISVVFSSLAIMMSCSKIENDKYSCDEDVNQFVIDNKEELCDLSREELIVYREDIQKAAFRAMPVKSRLELWQDKFNALEMLNWSISEKQFILDVERCLTQKMFDELTLSDELYRESLDAQFNIWINYCLSDLNWSVGKVYSLLGTLEIQVDGNNVLIESFTSNNSSDMKSSEQGTCKCSTTSDWCNSGGGGEFIGHCGKTTPCIKGSIGCGTLWTYSCDGMCELGPQND